MKNKSYFLVFIVIIFNSCYVFHPFKKHPILKFKNNSDNPVYIDVRSMFSMSPSLFNDTTIKFYNPEADNFDIYHNGIKPHSEKIIRQPIRLKSWIDIINNPMNQGILVINVYDEQTTKRLSYTTLKNTKLYLKKYYLTVYALEQSNWIVNFPPDSLNFVDPPGEFNFKFEPYKTR